MKMNASTLHSFVKRFNLYLPVAALLIILGLVVKGLFFKPSYSEPELPVMITDESELEAYDIDSVPDLTFVKLVDGYYFFSMKRGYFYPHRPYELKLQSISAFGSSHIHPEHSVVNFLIREPDGLVRRLFEEDTWILEVDFPTDHKYEPFLSNIILRVIDEDTNGDGFLRMDDEVDLYVADRRGNNLKKVLDDIQSIELVASDTLLIGRWSNKAIQNFEYQIQEDELVELFNIQRSEI